MPCTALQPGLIFRQSILVDENVIIPSLSGTFAGLAEMPPVFATAYMVGLMEWTCVDGLRRFLLDGEHTVGTLVDVSHIAATPVGVRVTAEAHLLAVVGRNLRFRILCRDEHELVGEGTHERAVIRASNFINKVGLKRIAIDA